MGSGVHWTVVDRDVVFVTWRFVGAAEGAERLGEEEVRRGEERGKGRGYEKGETRGEGRGREEGL